MPRIVSDDEFLISSDSEVENLPPEIPRKLSKNSKSASSKRSKLQKENIVVRTESHYSDSKAVEDIYQKKTQLEHILLRPDTYIGSVEACSPHPTWVVDEDTGCMTLKTLSFVPGFYKIFDEILVNASDNKVIPIFYSHI